MILSFKKQFPQKIVDGTKIHSIREDPHQRWKPGRKIHMATGVRTKNYNCFMESVCVSVQSIRIEQFEGISLKKRIVIDDMVFHFFEGKMFLKPAPALKYIKQLAKNDGFDSVDDFFKWFSSDFQGRIIHWTDFKY